MGNFGWGRPAKDLHAGKYGELTPSRQREGEAGIPGLSFTR